MPTNFNDAQTEPDPTPPPHFVPPLGPTIAWDPNATKAAGWQPGQPPPYSATIPYPGPYAPPGGGGPLAPLPIAYPNPAHPAPAPQQWPGGASPNAPTVVNPQPAPIWAPVRAPAVSVPAPRAAPRTRPAVSAPAPRVSVLSIPAQRVWRLLPLPHILLGVGLILMMAALNIPWGATAGGTLVYAQSFSIPFFSDQPGVASQLAQDIVTSAGLLSLSLAGLNYLLTGMNWLARPIGGAGCATALFMPLMLCLMFLLLLVDGGALIFGAFDPLVGVALAPWQQGFTLNGAHAELGYYAWYTGVILNTAGMFTQPFVRR